MASKFESRLKKLEDRVEVLEHRTIIYKVHPPLGKVVTGIERVIDIERKDLTIIHEIPIFE